MVSKDFIRQMEGYGLTTAKILYRMPDHPSFLQTYIWQEYDLAPRFPGAHRVPGLLEAGAGRAASFGHGHPCPADPSRRDPGR